MNKIKLGEVKSMRCNAEVTHSILYWINGYLIETFRSNFYSHIYTSRKKDMVNHENMTRNPLFFHNLSNVTVYQAFTNNN